MFELVPALSKKTGPPVPDSAILGAVIMAELNTVRVYERVMHMVYSKEIKQLLFHTAQEELKHAGRFMALWLKENPQPFKLPEKCEKEIKRLPEFTESESIIASASGAKRRVADY